MDELSRAEKRQCAQGATEQRRTSGIGDGGPDMADSRQDVNDEEDDAMNAARLNNHRARLSGEGGRE
jgi:hypothetical protein